VAETGQIVGRIAFDVVLRSKDASIEESVGEVSVPVRATIDGTGSGVEVQTADIEQALAGLGRAYGKKHRRRGRPKTRVNA
jgi:hypothetical protein